MPALSFQATDDERPADAKDPVRDDARAEASLRLRFRLLGASALLLLAVVLLPWVFDGAGWAEIAGDDVAPSPPPVFAAPEFAEPPSAVAALPEWSLTEADAASSSIADPSDVNAAPTNLPLDSSGPSSAGVVSSGTAEAPASAASPDLSAGRSGAGAEPARTREALSRSESSTASSTPGSGERGVSSTAASGATGEGWIVQLGSFRDTANAEVLARRVQGFGFQAYVEAPDSATGLHRVRIGPYRERSSADAVRERLARQHSVESIVVPMVPPAR